MPVFLEILKKIAPYLKYVIFGTAIVLLLALWQIKSKQVTQLNAAMDLYKRQLSGQLTDKEKQLEAANNALGIAKSKMMQQDELLKAYLNDKIETTTAFDKYKKQYNIELESYQQTIAQLKQQVHGGITTVNNSIPRPSNEPQPDPQYSHPIDPKTQKLSYTWKSGDGRFELDDADVFTPNNETFVLHQNFRITGEIYRQKVGFLKTERLVVEEVVVVGKNADGTPIYKSVGTAEVVDSHFNYTEKAPDAWVPKKSIFGVWGVVSANLGFNNGLNPRFMLGTGLEFLNWKGLGLGLQIYLDTKVWQESGFGVDLAYRPIIKDTKLNLAINLGLATQFQNPFQSYIPMIGVKFYLW